jgi:hypothetical protein
VDFQPAMKIPKLNQFLLTVISLNGGTWPGLSGCLAWVLAGCVAFFAKFRPGRRRK